jgi:hypothetical protein
VLAASERLAETDASASEAAAFSDASVDAAASAAWALLREFASRVL